MVEGMKVNYLPIFERFTGNEGFDGGFMGGVGMEGNVEWNSE